MEKKVRIYFIGIMILLLGVSLACQLPGVIGDVKSVIDSSGNIKETVENLASQIPPGFEKTAQAAVTQMMDENVQKTVDASLAQLENLNEKNPPPDVPLLGNRTEEYSMTPDLVSYSADIPYADALDFYKTEMPANGWTFEQTGSAEADGAAALNFEKENRKAVVALSRINDMTVVMVTISTK